MQGRFSKKDCAILHDAMHLADLHNLGEDVNVAINFGKRKTYVRYGEKDVWRILKKLCDKMEGEK
tara:strand:+ start:119 stop:313 length:195 start_codon:yes stop_codon:yes gene_type:complete